MPPENNSALLRAVRHLMLRGAAVFICLTAVTSEAASLLILGDDPGGLQEAFLESAAGGSHAVDQVSVLFQDSLDAGERSALEAYDLVIIGQNAFTNGYAHTDFNELTVPILVQDGAAVRSATLNWFDTGSASTSIAVSLTVLTPVEAVFGSGVSVNDVISIYSETEFTFSWFPNLDLAGGSMAGNGTVLGAIDLGVGMDVKPWMVVWEAGEYFYGDGSMGEEQAAGRRTFLAMPLQDGHFADLTSAGEELLANAVNFAIVPEPSRTILIFLSVIMGLLYRRRTSG